MTRHILQVVHGSAVVLCRAQLRNLVALTRVALAMQIRPSTFLDYVLL